jgi:hypothetical protein
MFALPPITVDERTSPVGSSVPVPDSGVGFKSVGAPYGRPVGGRLELAARREKNSAQCIPAPVSCIILNASAIVKLLGF